MVEESSDDSFDDLEKIWKESDKFKEIKEKFIGDLAYYIDEFTKANNAKDANTLHELSHKIKPALLMYEFIEASNIVVKIVNHKELDEQTLYKDVELLIVELGYIYKNKKVRDE